MPDLITVFSKRWKLIAGLTLLSVLIAFVVCLISPKKYLSTATALPANTLIADKARIFNNNIEALYSDFGTTDELDKLEGTAALDTIFIAAAEKFDLANHYTISPSGEATYKAALKLKKNSHIARSGYGELKIKVWDEDRNLAAAVANNLMQSIQALHQHLQNENNALALQQIKQAYKAMQGQYQQIIDTNAASSAAGSSVLNAKKAALFEQLMQYEKLIGEYELTLRTNPQALLVVEPARPSFWYDKPKVLQTVLFTLAAAFACSFLLALLLESRKNVL